MDTNSFNLKEINLSILKLNKVSFYLSISISLFCVIVFIIMAFMFLDLNGEEIFKFSIFSFLSILIFSYIFLFYRFESLVILRLNEIYKKLLPTSSSYEIKKPSDIDLFTNNLKKINSDKNLEIEMLKNQENYRKEFIGNIAHELKTPLFTIQGYILTLLDAGVTDKEIIKKYLKRTSKGVERLTYVVKDLDLITKFESGMANLELKTFDIVFTIKNVFEQLEMRAKKNNITLKINDEYFEPIYVYADEERIQQVITNLIINSLKYGVDRGVTEVSIDSLKKGKILIRISDNGEGIEQKHLPRLFERFYRVEKTRNRTLGGSGLGLSIVKHIIDAHNEKIFVESQTNIGSEFSFTLPKGDKTQLIQE